MLARLEPRVPYGLLAEMHKTTNLLPQLRQRLIVSKGKRFRRLLIMPGRHHVYPRSYHDILRRGRIAPAGHVGWAIWLRLCFAESSGCRASNRPLKNCFAPCFSFYCSSLKMSDGLISGVIVASSSNSMQ